MTLIPARRFCVTKSMKHYRHGAMLIAVLADASAAWTVARVDPHSVLRPTSGERIS